MKYQGIIFDFNGVLLWDSHLHEKAWLELSKDLRGVPFSPEELASHMHGKPNKYIFEYLLKCNLTEEELQILCFQKESRYRNLCLKNASDFQLSPGAIELLDFIVQKNIPHTIATFAPKDNLDFFIKHLRLDLWFDIGKIVYDNGSFSCKSEMYLLAARNLNLQPEQCIAIEDSVFGITAAVRANIGKVIGLGPKEMHDALLRLKGISHVITALDQIEKANLPGC
jgi:beta-phosphoglucomutase-like phosphatase (HAD superfamily)